MAVAIQSVEFNPFVVIRILASGTQMITHVRRSIEKLWKSTRRTGRRRSSAVMGSCQQLEQRQLLTAGLGAAPEIQITAAEDSHVSGILSDDIPTNVFTLDYTYTGSVTGSGSILVSEGSEWTIMCPELEYGESIDLSITPVESEPTGNSHTGQTVVVTVTSSLTNHAPTVDSITEMFGIVNIMASDVDNWGSLSVFYRQTGSSSWSTAVASTSYGEFSFDAIATGITTQTEFEVAAFDGYLYSITSHITVDPSIQLPGSGMDDDELLDELFSSDSDGLPG